MPSPRSVYDAGRDADVHTGSRTRAWRAGLLSGIALAIIAIAAAVVVAGDFTSETPHKAPPTDDLPDESVGTTTTSTEPEIISPTFLGDFGDGPSCRWGRGSLYLDADIGFIGALTVQPECWPGFAADELWRLAVSQTLADAWENGGPEAWRRRLLAICADIDTAVAANSLARSATGTPLTSDPAALAYSWHRGIATDLFDERQQDWRLAQLEWAAAIAEDMASRAGLAWKYTALTAAGLYCPEHQTHLWHHRDERLILETTVRRCVTSRDGWCLHFEDVAATPGLLDTLNALAELEPDRNVARE